MSVAATGVGPVARAGLRRRRIGSGAALLSLGTVASGLLAYAFNLVAARTLGPEAYGPVAVLWASLFLCAVVLFRPLEQTLSQAVADRLARGQDPWPAARTVLRLGAVLAAGALCACALGWGALTERAFAGQAGLTAALAVGLVGYAASFCVRGLASGTGRLGAYGLLLLADGGVRLGVALALLVVASSAWAAGAIAAAAVGGAVVGLLAGGHAIAARLRTPGAPAPLALGRAGRFAGPAGVVAAAEQVIVSGGPLLVLAHGGSGAQAAAGVVFAATMLVRAPVFLFQGVAAALLPRLTAASAADDEAAVRRTVGRTAGVLGLLAAGLAAGAALLGPWAMEAVYGAGYRVGAVDLALLGAGAGGFLAASTFAQAVLARGQVARAALGWSAAAATFVAVELLVGGSPVHRVAVACAAACALAVAVQARLALARGRRDVP